MKRNLLIVTILLQLVAASLSAQEIPNGSFEQWVVEGNDTVPAYWKLSSFGAGRTTDATSGSNAISIWNWYCYGKGTLASAGIPLLGDPGLFSITGDYKYVLGENGGSGHGADDSALAMIAFMRFNPVTQVSDTMGYAVTKLAPSGPYTTFNANVNVIGNFDTVFISFSSSEQGFCTSQDCQCCYLTLDNLSWKKLQDNVDKEVTPVDEPAMPNPFETETTLGTAPQSGCRVIVSTTAGVDVLESSYKAGEQMILSGTHLAAGTYVYRIVTTDGTKTGKVIKR